MSRGWGNERRVWAFESGVGSGGQRDGSEQEIPPLIPPPFFPFSSTWQWTLSKVQIHCHSEWMNEWWHGEVSGHSRFELWLLTNVTPCHLHQPKNLHNAIINPPHASLSSQQLFCLLGVTNVKFQEHRSNFQGAYLPASNAGVLWQRLQWYLTPGADISFHIGNTANAPVPAEDILDPAACGLKVF